MSQKWWAKVLRFLSIVLMGITATFTLLSGVGTSCVAINPTGFGDKLAPLAKVQWLYIIFVIVTLCIGIIGIRATIMLSKRFISSYRDAVLILGSGILVGSIHMAVSYSLRGSSMPEDMVVYITILTLLIFLLLRIPAIWQKIAYEKPENQIKTGRRAVAISLLFSGILILTVQYLMLPTHNLQGINFADVWHGTLSLIGTCIILISVVIGTPYWIAEKIYLQYNRLLNSCFFIKKSTQKDN